MGKVADRALLFYQDRRNTSSTSPSCPLPTHGLRCVVLLPTDPESLSNKKAYGAFQLGYLEGVGQCAGPLELLVLVGWGEGKDARIVQKGSVLEPELPWEELWSSVEMQTAWGDTTERGWGRSVLSSLSRTLQSLVRVPSG